MQDANIPLYDVAGFRFHENESMAGIFFTNAGDSFPSFNFLRPYPFLGLPEPMFFSIPTPFTICSSSKGLLLIHDHPTSTYHVCNPFVHARSSYWRLPAPPRFHSQGTPAVLAVDLYDPVVPSFYVVCAVQEYSSYYTFDTFDSSTYGWREALNPMDIGPGPRRIIANTGVSDCQGRAFWLTSVPHAVVRYHGLFNTVEQHIIPQDPRLINPWAALQLGRLGNFGVGVVASWRQGVHLFLNDHDDVYRMFPTWEPQGFLHVRRDNEDAATGGGGFAEVICRRPQVRPGVLRFERDVPLWINGRMTVWEVSHENRRQPRTRLHQMPGWARVPESVADSVPYVYTRMIPAQFIN